VEGVGAVKTEETADWIAWDEFGNVWYFGKIPRSFFTMRTGIRSAPAVRFLQAGVEAHNREFSCWRIRR